MEIIADPNAAIYLVGYQDPRSIGGMIKNSDEVQVGDELIEVKAHISKFSSFSGHLDGSGVLDYLSDISINKSVFLTHGEYDGMVKLKEAINSRNMECEIPDYNWELVIE